MNEDIFKQINRSKAIYEILFILGIVTTAIGFLMFLGTQMIGFFLFAGGGALTVIGKSGHSKLTAKLKDNVLNTIIKEHVTDGVYRAIPGISSEIVYESETLRKATRFTSEDYIEGKINDVHFIFSDLHLQDRRSTGKSSHYVTTFRGPFFQFEFNKNFQGRTFIMEGSMPTIFHGYEKLELESEHFNNVFKVYSNDPHNAFYILTPHFMEALLKLEARHEGKISISLIDNKVNIAIYNNEDTFECPMFRDFDKTIIDEFKNDLLIIKDIIESLKLDRVIYKEEKGEY